MNFAMHDDPPKPNIVSIILNNFCNNSGHNKEIDKNFRLNWLFLR